MVKNKTKKMNERNSIKRLLSLLLSIAMILSITAGLDMTAYAYTSGDFEYDFLMNGTLEIVGYSGEDEELIIPSTNKGLTVSKISEFAFSSNETLKSVIIPDTIKTIGALAFAECSALENVEISNGVKVIEFAAFSDCENLKHINIPASVE